MTERRQRIQSQPLLFGGLLLTIACNGCDATLQGLVTHVPTGTTSTHVGALAEGRLHLPRTYHWIAGAEAGHLGQTDPATVADQWRVGLVGGRSALLRPDGSRLASELTARIGIFRGSNGDLVGLGPYGGISFGAPIRISPNRDSWELDDLVYTTVMIVPQVGLNALVPGVRFADSSLELTASIGIRLNLSSTLLP